jgi:hypothetical protein
MTTQKRNAEMIDLLSTDFQGRYEPQFAMSGAISTFQSISAVRGIWCSSVIDENFALRDLAQQGRTLSLSGAIALSAAGLVPYCSYTGANYHYRADEAGLDIAGPLTLGGWFYIGNLGSTAPFQSKYTFATNQMAYTLLYSALSGAYELRISANGAAVTTLQSTVTPFVGWVFVAGRFIASTTMDIWVSNTPAGASQAQLTQTTLAAGVPAGIFNSNAQFMIGGINAGASMIGRHWISFLSAAPVTDVTIWSVFERTRAALGL